MDLRRLNAFIRIAENGSLTRAAGVLRIAQPALSRHLRLLEDELGVSLCTRSKRGVSLTQYGEHFYNAIAEPVKTLERSLAGFRSSPSGTMERWNIGLPPELGGRFSILLLERLASILPRVPVRLVEGTTGQLRDLLVRGVIDCAIIEGEVPVNLTTTFKVQSDRLMLVGGTESDLDPKVPVQFESLVGKPLLIPCQPFGVRQALFNIAGQFGLVLNVAHELDSLSSRLHMARMGKGYVLVPEYYVRETLHTLSGYAVQGASNVYQNTYGQGMSGLKVAPVRDVFLPFHVVFKVSDNAEEAVCSAFQSVIPQEVKNLFQASFL